MYIRNVLEKTNYLTLLTILRWHSFYLDNLESKFPVYASEEQLLVKH